MRLECGNCRVRDWHAADKDALLRVADNRKVWRNLTHRFPHPYTAADADAWLALCTSEPHPPNWAIEVEGQAAGGIGLEPGEGVYAGTARFGYWLGEPYWGRGIMTAAARAASDYALEQMGFLRLEAPVFAWNPASMRVLEKSGFEREALLRNGVQKDGEIVDVVLYARLR